MHYKMVNLDSVTNENKKWSYISDHPYRILVIGGNQEKQMH